MDLSQLERKVLDGQDLTFLNTVPYVYHCHHYNLFHDQTVDDALGEAEGIRLRTAAAQAAFAHLIAETADGNGDTPPSEHLQRMAAFLPWMGHGRLDINGDSQGGEAHGTHLHYGHTWSDKYGEQVKRLHPADAVAGGLSAASIEHAFGLEPGSIEATETACIAMRDSACHFVLNPRTTPTPPPLAVGLPAYAQHTTSPPSGQDEDRIAEIAAGLRDFLRGIEGDSRGLVQAFGIYATLHLSSYYNHTAFETVQRIEEQAPGKLPYVEALFREAGHVCVFNTFGNILLSPEWEGMVGPLSGKIEDTVTYCCAVARGLGFGHWSIGELEPNRRFVLTAPGNYETPYYNARFGCSDRPRSYIFQGAALAIMQLAHAVDWTARPTLTQAFYGRLFRSGKLPWKIETPRCRTCGDVLCEVVVTPS